MPGGSIPAWIQAGAATLMFGGLVSGTYHRFVVAPAREDAEVAKTTAREAKAKADGLDNDLRETLEELSGGVERLERESRGHSYQLYVLSKAINEHEEMPDVAVPDEDDFLRGGD